MLSLFKNQCLRNYSFILLISACFGLFGVSCQKEATNPVAIQHVKKIPNNGPYNSSNPYDSLGIKHNMAISYSFSHMHWADTASQQAYLNGFTEQMKAYANGINYPNYEAEIDSAIYVNNGQDPLSDLRQYSNSSMTSSEITYIRMIGDVLADTTNNSIDDMKQNILDLETEILAINWQSNETGALKAISYAKHSFYYWSSLFESVPLSKRANTCIPEKWWPYIYTVACDIGGGVTLGWVGAATTSASYVIVNVYGDVILSTLKSWGRAILEFFGI